MLIKPKRQLTTFRQAALEIQAKGSNFTGTLMGLVADVSRPLPRERDKDYIVELKLVDQTINENKMYGILIRYCSVYLFGKTKEQLEICNSIGQIVLLDQFSLNVWNEIKLQTKYLSSIEKIYCLELKEGELQVQNSLLSTQDELDLTATHFKQRAIELQQWFEGYFSKTHRPLLGITLINNYSIMADPFNMILQKATCPQKIEQEQDNRLFLEDAHNNLFFINKHNLPSNLPQNKFIFVRGVEYIGNFYQIILTDTGNILGLPLNCQQYYLKAMNYCAVSRFNQKFMLQSHKACQLSKLSYVTTKTTPIIELLNNIEMYENRRSVKDELHIEDLYMIEAVAINYSGNLRLFHTEHQLLAHQDFVSNLSSDERKEIIDNEQLAYLYEGTIGVIDRSSECTGRLLFVHLFSNEDRTQFYDPAAMKELNKGAGLLTNRQLEVNTKAKIEDKLQKLIQKSDFTNTISMLVEPIRSDVLLFRLIHTIFT